MPKYSDGQYFQGGKMVGGKGQPPFDMEGEYPSMWFQGAMVSPEELLKVCVSLWGSKQKETFRAAVALGRMNLENTRPQ